jgi:hypothetical protein
MVMEDERERRKGIEKRKREASWVVVKGEMIAFGSRKRHANPVGMESGRAVTQRSKGMAIQLAFWCG